MTNPTMPRSLLTAALLLAAVAGAPRAQCAPIGPPCTSSGMRLVCITPPIIGTQWQFGEQNASVCGSSTTVLTLFGQCFNPGIPIDPPIACATCGGCELNVLPVWATLAWTWPPRGTSVGIPLDPNLIGKSLCMQDACADPAAGCVCLSQAQQVTFQ